MIYDSLHGRWLATEVSWDCDTSDPAVQFGHGYIDIAISETTDPTSFWDGRLCQDGLQNHLTMATWSQPERRPWSFRWTASGF